MCSLGRFVPSTAQNHRIRATKANRYEKLPAPDDNGGLMLFAVPLAVADAVAEPVGDPVEDGPGIVAPEALDIRYTSPEASDETYIRPCESTAIPAGRKQSSGHFELSWLAKTSRAAVLL